MREICGENACAEWGGRWRRLAEPSDRDAGWPRGRRGGRDRRQGLDCWLKQRPAPGHLSEEPRSHRTAVGWEQPVGGVVSAHLGSRVTSGASGNCPSTARDHRTCQVGPEDQQSSPHPASQLSPVGHKARGCRREADDPTQASPGRSPAQPAHSSGCSEALGRPRRESNHEIIFNTKGPRKNQWLQPGLRCGGCLLSYRLRSTHRAWRKPSIFCVCFFYRIRGL